MLPIPRYIYGLHDLGGENLMLDAGTPGWVVVTTRARDSGGDYAGPASAGLGVIVRLNHDYGLGGTLPASTEYAVFAQQCAAFVGRSRGAKVWIIGNETNLAAERPGNTGGNDGEVIPPDKYAQCFAQCRAAILGLPGHADDWVAPAPPGPWNTQTTYPGNPSGDWVKYYQDVLNLLVKMQAPPGALALHTYTHGFEPGLVSSQDRMNPPFAAYHCHFRAFRDFLGVVPASLRALPVFITETQPADPAWWQNRNTRWIQAAYDEINAWNADPAHQAIWALCLFRWERGDERWSISDKPALHDDFRAALRNRYQVKPAVPVSSPPLHPPPPLQVPSETGWCPFAIKRPIIGSNFAVGRQGHRIRAVVLHIAAGSMANVFDTFNNPDKPVSAHFCVGKDGTLEQYVSIDDTAYGNGLGYQDGQWINPRGAPVKPTWQDLVPGLNPNLYTISVEHDGQPQEAWTRAMDAANTRLLQWIAQQCALTYIHKRTLIGHCEIDPSKPNCPGPQVNYEQIAAAANAPAGKPEGDAVVQAARRLPWLPINVDSALFKFARATSLGCPQTDEFDFQVDGAAYVGQVFGQGVVYVKKGDWGNVAWTAKPEAGGAGADATAQSARAAAGQRTWMPINSESALYEFAQARQLGCPQTDEFEFAVASTRYVGQVFAGGIIYAEKANVANVAWVDKPAARAIAFAGPEAASDHAAPEPRIARARRAPVKKTRRPAKKRATQTRRAQPPDKRRPPRH